MKSKLFKKLIAVGAAAAMTAQLGFVIPVSAADYWTMDFESAADTTGWTSQYYADGMSIATDSDPAINKYFNYLNGTGKGTRTAYYTLPADAQKVNENKQSVLEFDFKLHNGGGQANNQIVFIAASGTPIGNGDYSSNGYALQIMQPKDKSAQFALNGTDVYSSGYQDNTWAHAKAVLDFNMKDALVTITSLDGSTTYYETSKVNMGANASALTYAFVATARDNSSTGLDNIVIRDVEEGDITGTYYKVTFDVDGTETVKSVQSGEAVADLPSTDKTGYIFQGWAMNGDESNLLTAADILAMTITADTAFTAVYEKDPAYIEPMTSVQFKDFPQGGFLTAGEDENTAASNLIGVKITGELGTDLLNNPDSRVNDLSVTYELKGFRWVASKNEPTTDAEGSDSYCDSYGKLVENNDHTIDFQLKSHPFNYYGQIIATVTYNGETKTIAAPLAYLGDTAKASANDILPRGGYVSDFNKYSPDMVGYEATISPDNKSASDAATDNWGSYGGNTRTLKIAEEDGKKFMRLNALGTNSSCFASNIIDPVTDTQVVFDQMVRFANANSEILLKSKNPVTWDTGSITANVKFTGTGFTLNEGSEFAPATTGTWYRVVVSSDVTSAKCFAKVYSEDGQLLGESETVDFMDTASLTPSYYMYRLPDRAPGELDFNDTRSYRVTVDQSTITTTQSAETLSIPMSGTDAVTADLTINGKTTEDYDLIGKVDWTVVDDVMGVTVTPASDNSHNATVSVDSSASGGVITINATLAGITTPIEINLTSSQDSVKFIEKLRSVSIPMDDTDSVAEYKAIVVDGEGNELTDKTVTYGMYDKNNANPITIDGVTFENGILTVTSKAKAATFYIRATSTNTDGDTITSAVKVVLHGLAFDFGAGTDADVMDGYTAISPTTGYNSVAGYGIEGTATVGGEASLEDADADNLTGTFTFKANVPNSNAIYKVILNYSGTASFEKVSQDLTGVVRTNATKSAVEYYTFVSDDVLDITFSDSTVSSIIIEKVDAKTTGAKPNVYTVGDSTIANNGSWAYVLARDLGNYTELADLATFTNNGRGGKNLMTYYSGGEFWDRVVMNIRPGDYVMIGDMGTNGMGSTFRDDFNFYIDTCLALGANVILNSYSPHGPVEDGYYELYDSQTQTFKCYRQDAYDVIVREIYNERNSELTGFIDIGNNADTAFNAYVDDYASNGYASRDAAAQAIMSCFGDHNHYSNGPLAAQLMIEGYNGTPGIVSSLIEILKNAPEPLDVTYGQASMADGAVTIPVTTSGEGTASANVFVAQYDKDGVLIDSVVEAQTVTQSTTELSVKVTENENAASIMLYIWDKDMTPQTNAQTLKKQQLYGVVDRVWNNSNTEENQIKLITDSGKVLIYFPATYEVYNEAKSICYTTGTPDDASNKFSMTDRVVKYEVNDIGYITSITKEEDTVMVNEGIYNASTSRIGPHRLSKDASVVDISEVYDPNKTHSYTSADVSLSDISIFNDNESYTVILTNYSNSDDTYNFALLLALN